jgi:hypothetical protein
VSRRPTGGRHGAARSRPGGPRIRQGRNREPSGRKSRPLGEALLRGLGGAQVRQRQGWQDPGRLLLGGGLEPSHGPGGARNAVGDVDARSHPIRARTIHGLRWSSVAHILLESSAGGGRAAGTRGAGQAPRSSLARDAIAGRSHFARPAPQAPRSAPLGHRFGYARWLRQADTRARSSIMGSGAARTAA